MKQLRLLILVSVFWMLSALAAAQSDVRLVFTIENRGDFTITLNTKAAPKTCAHILKLAQDGFYNGLRFHRAERKPKPFLIQVGDPTTRDKDLEEKNPYRNGTGAKLPFEVNDLQNDLGAVGLARDAGDPASGDSQFYVLLSNSRFLNGKYTVFGQITSGLDVIQKIERGDKVSQVKVVRS